MFKLDHFLLKLQAWPFNGLGFPFVPLFTVWTRMVVIKYLEHVLEEK